MPHRSIISGTLTAAAVAWCSAAGPASASEDPAPWTAALLASGPAEALQPSEGPRLEGRIQFRYQYSHRERPAPEDDTQGFNFRRVRLGVTGELTDRIGYDIEGSFSRRTGDMNLTDASIDLRLNDRWLLDMGLFRPAFLREEIVSSTRQLFADRSLVALAFRQPRSIGLQISRTDEHTKFTASVMDRGGAFGGDESWGYTARFEWKVTGDWRSFRDFTADDERPLAVLLGAGALYQTYDAGAAFTPEPEHFRWTVDVSAEYDETTFFAALLGNRADPGDFTPYQDQFGVVLQAGYHVTDEVELVARYEWGDGDEAAKALNLASLGVNYYIAEHLVKFTGDIGYAFNEVNGLWSSTGAGWLTDRAGHDGQVVLRLQFQVVF